jgi:inner membrane protein
VGDVTGRKILVIEDEPSIADNVVYVSYVLRSVKRATGFTGLLTTLYTALYVLLRSEDMALLLGAALLFGILAAIMVVTRRVDWYRVAVEPADSPVLGAASSEA